MQVPFINFKDRPFCTHKSLGQLQGLCQIVNPRTNTSLDFRLLDSLLKQPLKEFQQLVQFAEQHFDGLQATVDIFWIFHNSLSQGDFTQSDVHDKDERAHFALFYRLFLFKRLLESVKFELLLKIVELIPSEKSQYEQLCILNELRMNLNQIPEREMKEVQKQISEVKNSFCIFIFFFSLFVLCFIFLFD